MQDLAAKPLDDTVAKPVTKLNLIAGLLDVFHKQNILYCHWKSNEHLDASMTGDTDLDVLFDIKQKGKLLQHLHTLGFKKFDSIKEKQYHDIEDYIGLDIPSGKVVHLHAHFRMTMGETYLKGYQLALEDKILKSRVYDETFGIYTSSPAFELILLYFREALKLRNREALKMSLLNRVNYSENVMKEYRWLKERVTDSQIETILKSLFNNYRPIYNLVTGRFNRKELQKLALLIKKEFKKYRLYSPAEATLTRWYREATVLFSRKLATLLNRPIMSQRINPRGGLTIAVVGADGSGKSTVTADLQNTFRTKLDVYRVYLGRGDGKISLARKVLLGARKMVGPEPKKGTAKKGNRNSGNKQKGLLANVYKCIEAMLVANEKSRNLERMQQAKQKGMLVICDRFPQNQIMGYNDGPLLNHLAKSSNPVFRAISDLEAKVYKKAENNPPDLVIKLIAEAEVVEARKPGETSLEMLEAKIAGIKALQFKDSCQVITIDASQPLGTVLATVKKAIWNNYR
ncbi:nucleoside/nucleotide kinase family protein [Adhaeribacter soli]|uniref:Thymidylate kinase n=1 Tax=Adhaeribacter soli TaxID=2607655 RepID=A0A5N1J2F8_9BACT|nr:hypothetical protein [Adhaeribacter soli]KAA9340712.1 hypothetical protein F0P94_04605 [Adhaeribacter soli]